jgi:hypothetical protein
MNYKEYINSKNLIKRLKSEVLLIPEELSLERGNLEWLIYQEEEKLAAIDRIPEPIKNLELTFRGKAVNGTESINAKFISNVASSFAEVINFLTKSIKSNDGSQLIIKDIVRGSFGFEFEALPGLQYELFESNTERSLAMFQDYLNHLINDDDDALDSFLVESNPTLITKLKNFFTVNSKYESWFVSNFSGNKLDTKNKEGIDAIISRISLPPDECEIILNGFFHGCLPSARRFDFIVSEESYSIKISSSIQLDQVEEILQKDNESAKIKVKQISRGGRKPKYLLESFENISYIEL